MGPNKGSNFAGRGAGRRGGGRDGGRVGLCENPSFPTAYFTVIYFYGLQLGVNGKLLTFPPGDNCNICNFPFLEQMTFRPCYNYNIRTFPSFELKTDFALVKSTIL